jgi:hypothetical protein
MRRTVLVLLLASLPALWAAAPVRSSTFLAMEDSELIARSTVVVDGEVLRVDSFWTEDGAVIVSEATVEVREVVHGIDVPATVTVRTFGGSVGSYRIDAHGFPAFRAGERVLLFLEPQAGARAGERVLRVTGYQLGHYRVRADRDGVEMALPTLEPGVRLLTAGGRAAARPAALPLDELKSRIRALAADRPAAPAR